MTICSVQQTTTFLVTRKNYALKNDYQLFNIYTAFHENLIEILNSVSGKQSIINAKKDTLAETKAIL